MKHQWTVDEYDLLKEAVRKYGSNWYGIQKKYFPRMTVEQIKAKYYELLRKVKRNVS